jgi:acetyl-CoA carboxylase biotin carboxyl carrier protein
MDLDLIKSLIDAMAASDLAEMEFSEGGWSLRLVRRPQAGEAAAHAKPAHRATQVQAEERPQAGTVRLETVPQHSSEDAIVAPLFGIVHLQPAPDAPPFVSPGQAVTAGTPLCTIEAMKMFHEIRAERDGTISSVLVLSGEEVQAGQELMRFA